MLLSVVRRLLVGVCCLLGVIGISATSAGAFSLAPTNWSSSITSIVPSDDAVAIEVIDGGDAMRLTARLGHVVVIPGYRNEPYLRITATGEVDANLRSPTWWANSTSTGTGDILESADPTAEPEWSRVGDDGSVLWHDHRVHAMPGVTGDTDWSVLVTVDDLPVVVRGRLTKLPSHTPIAELVLAIVAAAGVLVFGNRSAWRTVRLATISASVLAMFVAIGGWTATPTGFDPPRAAMVATGLAVVFALASTLVRRTSRRLRSLFVIGSIAALGWWIALMVPSITAAVVPNSFSPILVRSILAIVGGVVVGVAIVVVMTGGFSDTDEGDQAETAELAEPSL